MTDMKSNIDSTALVHIKTPDDMCPVVGLAVLELVAVLAELVAESVVEAPLTDPVVVVPVLAVVVDAAELVNPDEEVETVLFQGR